MMVEKTSDAVQRNRPLAGVVPVFQTPYHDDESIDFETLNREIGWLFDHGADGIALAMVSEVLRLSTDERKQLAQAACETSRGRGFTVISVGAESTRTAVDYAQHAESVGADAIMAIPPVTTSLDEDQLHRYFAQILALATSH